MACGRVRIVAPAVLILSIAGLVLASCTSSPMASPPPRRGSSNAITDYLHLEVKTVIGGRTVNGDLVIENPGKPLNLTRGCAPQLAVGLDKGSFHQEIAFPSDCRAIPVIVKHGETDMAFVVSTTYNACTQAGPVTKTLPRCLSSGPPPLPPGTYTAKAIWGGVVVLPTPKPVSLTVLPAS